MLSQQFSYKNELTPVKCTNGLIKQHNITAFNIVCAANTSTGAVDLHIHSKFQRQSQRRTK